MSRERPQIRLALPDVRNVATALALASIVISVVWFVLFQTVQVSLYLVPGEVFRRLHLWQPFTWLLASIGAMPVLFNALILWSIGGSLERMWGRTRFLRFALGITFAAGLLTLALAPLIPSIQAFPYRGGEVMASTVWVGYGLAIWAGQTSLFGFSMTGRTFAAIGVLIPAMGAVFSGPLGLLPDFLGIALAFLVLRGRASPSDLLERFGSWRLQRQLKKRSSRLQVLSGDGRNMPKDSDKYLH